MLANRRSSGKLPRKPPPPTPPPPRGAPECLDHPAANKRKTKMPTVEYRTVKDGIFSWVEYRIHYPYNNTITEWKS